MNGVIEEKTSRIIEVIISSVKPFELMMGKVIGIALVGLTQFLLWGILTYGITTAGGMVLATKSDNNTQMLTEMAATDDGNAQVEVAKEVNSGNKIDKLLKGVGSINIPWLLFAFVFYFMGGYLIYSALFAAIGAAVDNQTDAQQFMLPITGPVIFSIAMASFVIKDPDSTLSFWLSVVPFTSPIIMMIRMPFEPPLWEVLISMAMLVLGFVGTIWMAGRIYRVGILMYGKKVTYKELSKWLFYKG
jgi:ABC-2 type transport system permease protein